MNIEENTKQRVERYIKRTKRVGIEQVNMEESIPYSGSNLHYHTESKPDIILLR